MAHLCPDCGEPCTCSGDTGRIILDRLDWPMCEHCGALEQLVDEDPEAFDDDVDDEDPAA